MRNIHDSVHLRLLSMHRSMKTVFRLSLSAFISPLVVLPAQVNNVPADSSWRIVLIRPDEAGEPMVVTGTVFAADGRTPVAGVEVHVYHTDAEGYYRKGNNDSSHPRLQGTMMTNAAGKYEYRTIRPGPYPGGGNPAHVHYEISRAGHGRQYDELQFEGDPILGQAGRLTGAQKANAFAEVRPISRDDKGVWRVVKDIRLKE